MVGSRSFAAEDCLILLRVAQWEGQSRKYYYVQKATGHSQWDVPTQPALSVPTPDPTPQQPHDPFNKPGGVGPDGVMRNADGSEVSEQDRGFISVCDRMRLTTEEDPMGSDTCIGSCYQCADGWEE